MQTSCHHGPNMYKQSGSTTGEGPDAQEADPGGLSEKKLEYTTVHWDALLHRNIQKCMEILNRNTERWSLDAWMVTKTG